MKIKLHSANPHQPLRPIIENALHFADSIDIAVAFITRAGVDFLSKIKQENPNITMRVTTSVRWPTDIDALSFFVKQNPGITFIHLGGRTPHEKSADKYQLHSKIIAIHAKNKLKAFVGSHNWTSMALDGKNLECSLQISCSEREDIAMELRSHIESCVSESQLFNYQDKDAYLAIQRDLQPAPFQAINEEINEFEKYSAIVIHAEDYENLSARDHLRLFIGPGEDFASEFGLIGQLVDLYLYPQNSLFSSPHPLQKPTLFTGRITMINNKADARVEEREIDSAIFNLKKPKIESIDCFPNHSEAVKEVAVHLEKQGKQDPFVYHVGIRQNRPSIKDHVHYDLEDIPGLPYTEQSERFKKYLRKTINVKGIDFVNQYERPIFVKQEVTVDVPNPDLYQINPEIILKQKFSKPLKTMTDRKSKISRKEFFREEGRDFRVRAKKELKSRFIYSVTHRSKDII